MSPSEVLQVFAAAVVMSLYRKFFSLPVVMTKHVTVVCGGWGVVLRQQFGSGRRAHGARITKMYLNYENINQTTSQGLQDNTHDKTHGKSHDKAFDKTHDKTLSTYLNGSQVSELARPDV